MIKKWIAQQLTEITAWTGFFIMVAAFLHLSYLAIFMAGFFLLAVDDEWIKVKMAAWGPIIKAKLGA